MTTDQQRRAFVVHARHNGSTATAKIGEFRAYTSTDAIAQAARLLSRMGVAVVEVTASEVRQ